MARRTTEELYAETFVTSGCCSEERQFVAATIHCLGLEEGPAAASHRS